MLRAALQFVLLVAATWISFFAVPSRFRPHVLTLWGIVFYLAYAADALWPVTGVVVLTYLLSGRSTRWLLIAALASLLAYFKLPAVSAGSAATSAPAGGGAAIPLGFSFLAFELIHYAVERSRGRIKDASFANLAAFAFFFPCRVAGPIKRYREFIASVESAALTPEHVTQGCLRIGAGLLKKIALADPLGPVAAGLSVATTPVDAWIAALAYTFEIYFDFSAYSDLAIGISRLMGIRVPENFNWPYLSPNIQEFWNRWHMSLSSWVREYVFLPLGRELFKSRLRGRPRVISTLSYLVTFLTVGAWHGLSSNYLLWGAYHGVLVSAFQIYKTTIPVRVATSAIYRSEPARWAATGLTFLPVTLGWVIFRLDPPDAFNVLRLMLTGHQ